jgi:RHS repeat-associated protein
MTYSWDARQLIGEVTDHGDYAYEYDDAGRLIAADHPTAPDFGATFDAAGNRLTDLIWGAGESWSYGNGHQLEAIGDAATFTWDTHGNMASRTVGGVTTTYTYNAANQLIEVAEDGDLIAEYTYDAEGRRASKTVGDATTYYLYSAEGLLAEFDQDGNELVSYGWVPNTQWQTAPVYMKVGAEVYWFVVDRMNTPRKLIDSDGAVVWSLEIEAFGAGHPSTDSTVPCNLRLAGQYYDAETSLHYNNYRYYDPALGKYLTRDPLLEAAPDLHFYDFGIANPIVFLDPSGAKSSASTGFGYNSKGEGTSGMGVEVGAWNGVGGRIAVDMSSGIEPCCYTDKNGNSSVASKVCIKASITAEGGIGWGKEGGGASGVIKIASLEGKGECSWCEKCGEAGTESDCCITLTIKIGEAKVEFGWFSFTITLVKIPFTWCLNSPNPPTKPEYLPWSASGGPSYP